MDLNVNAKNVGILGERIVRLKKFFLPAMNIEAGLSLVGKSRNVMVLERLLPPHNHNPTTREHDHDQIKINDSSSPQFSYCMGVRLARVLGLSYG